MFSFVHFLNQERFQTIYISPCWSELAGTLRPAMANLFMRHRKKSWLQKEYSTLFHLCSWQLLHQHLYPHHHHHHHHHHHNLHWQVQTGRRCSSSSDSGRTRRGRSLWCLFADPGRKNKKIIIKDKKLTLNNCWTMDKHLHDYHILGGAKRFCCQRAVGSLTTIFWHRTMTLNCLTL